VTAITLAACARIVPCWDTPRSTSKGGRGVLHGWAGRVSMQLRAEKGARHRAANLKKEGMPRR